jgi:hypothetical protein
MLDKNLVDDARRTLQASADGRLELIRGIAY